MKKVKILYDIKIYSKKMFDFKKDDEPLVTNELAYRLIELKKAKFIDGNLSPEYEYPEPEYSKEDDKSENKEEKKTKKRKTLNKKNK